MNNKLPKLLDNEKGGVLVMVTVALTALLGMTALAIDIGRLTVVKNELQNAADAGALAGTLALLNDDGTINTEANTEAVTTALKNQSDGELLKNIESEKIEVVATRGHWSFYNKTFEANDSLTQIDLLSKPMLDDENPNATNSLDLDPAFINAVQVVIHRSDVNPFFAQIMGIFNFSSSADAVAYLGFPGDINKGEVDLPIAICEETIGMRDGDLFDCNVGRMMNENTETAVWVNYEQLESEDIDPTDPPDLTDPTPQDCPNMSANDLKPILKPEEEGGEGGLNPDPITTSLPVAASNGTTDDAFRALYDLWLSQDELDTKGGGEDEDGNDIGDGIPDIPWNMNLLVVDCYDDESGAAYPNTCLPVKTSASINIMWIARNANDPVPRVMIDGDITWSCVAEFTDAQCWEDFSKTFELLDNDNEPLTVVDSTKIFPKKTIFFKPDCALGNSLGGTGGAPSNIMAKYPKLVE